MLEIESFDEDTVNDCATARATPSPRPSPRRIPERRGRRPCWAEGMTRELAAKLAKAGVKTRVTSWRNSPPTNSSRSIRWTGGGKALILRRASTGSWRKRSSRVARLTRGAPHTISHPQRKTVMATTTVAQFADELKMPSRPCFEQLVAAGREQDRGRHPGESDKGACSSTCGAYGAAAPEKKRSP